MTSKILGFSLVFAILFGLSSAYKMVIFVPNLSNSQVQFCARVAQTLSGAGHDVTMLFVNHFEDFEISVKIPDGVKKHYLNAIVKGASKTELEKEQAKLIFKDSSVFDPEMFRMMKKFTGTLQEGCRLAIRDPHFLPWLKSEKFDLAFTYIYSTCPLGFVHLANIPFVWLNSGPLMDFVAQSIGVPTFPSYIPPVMMEATDSMTFFERTKSFIGHFMSGIVSRHLIAKQETQIFRDELNDPNFPETLDIGAKCPLVMVNTNPIYDLPRPLLAKVIPIGGLGVGFGDAKPLQPDFQKIATTGKGVVVFSFGSVAAAHEMPVEWKNALLETFADFPDYQFVMRYVDNDIRDRLPKNVHIFKWLPQKDLLLHNNTKAFITHGGYNSMQEAISAGVPLMTIALFGDQPKNSKIAAKHGIAVNINKATLSKATISDGLRKLLTDSSYSLNVKKLSAMVRRQPIKSDDLLIKWSEFAAEFKTLENLQPKSVELNVFQLFSLDVIAFLISLAALLVFLIYQLLRVLWVAIFGKKSPKIKKKDETKKKFRTLKKLSEICLKSNRNRFVRRNHDKKSKTNGEDEGKKKFQKRGAGVEKRRLFFNSRSPLPLGIQNDDDAKLFADELLPGERKMLFDRLRKITADQYNEHKQVTEVTIHHDDLRKIWNINFVPMFVYGILDEAFLIIGGDTINYLFNIYNGMSMLASAAVANIAVNMFLQIPVDRSLHWFAIKKPVLSTDQMNTIEFKRVTWSARLTGLWLGLTLGMIPLFYLDDNMDRRMIEREIDWYLATGDRKRMLESHEYCDLKELREESVGSKINIIANKNGVNFEE